MRKTARYRKQHEEILDLACEITKYLEVDILLEKPQQVRLLLARLAGVLNMHLAMEDNSLYPKLSSSNNSELITYANNYAEEMIPLKAIFNSFLVKWPSGAKICEDPAGFITETKAVFDALGKRIHKENTELYPLVDKLDV